MSTYKILSFCGGGERGLMSVKMLQKLQAENPGLLQHTNMLTGCSTGAIISSFLALYKKYNPFSSEQDVENALSKLTLLYTDIIPKVFEYASEQYPDPKKPEVPADNMTQFHELIAKLISANVSVEQLNELEMSDLKSSFDLMFPAFNIQLDDRAQPGSFQDQVINKSWGMELFNNYQHSETGSVPILDAMMASGAMPGMVSTAVVHESSARDKVLGYCVDGAFVNHDPTMAAVSMAVSQGHKLEDISVICFGTGFMRNYIHDPKSTLDWGSEQWLNIDGGKEYLLSKVPPLFVNDTRKNPILNMCLNGTSTNEIPGQSSLLLGQRYAYLNPDLGDEYIPEDAFEESKLNRMIELADGVSLSSATNVVRKYWC